MGGNTSIPILTKNIKSIIRVEDGHITSFSEIKSILDKNNKYYFHGTNACKTLKILENSFKFYKDYILPIGPNVYFSDDIEVASKFGSFVFVCLLPDNKNLDFCVYSKKETADYVFLKERLHYINDFANICSREVLKLKIEYIIEFYTNINENLDLSPLYNFSCLIDIKNDEYLEEYNSYKMVTTIKEQNLWIIGINLQSMIQILNMNYIERKIKKKFETIVHISKESFATKELHFSEFFKEHTFFVVGKLLNKENNVNFEKKLILLKKIELELFFLFTVKRQN